MMVLAKHPKIAFRGTPTGPMGWDGLAMLLLSLLVILASGGLSLAHAASRVLTVGRTAPALTSARGSALVPGIRLKNGKISMDYEARLRRALSLGGVRLILLGGFTSASRVSEAEAGRRWLAARGADTATVVCEDSSRNTLENLRAARALIAAGGELVLVSNRYHLARAAALAAGLGLDVQLCAAESRLSLGPRTLALVLREAFFLHWYGVGCAFARAVRHQAMLQRIT